jgi:hypothetical protein
MSHDNAGTTTPAIVVRVQEQPAADPGSVVCRAVHIVAPTVAEGASVTLTETGDAFPACVAGANPPHAGDYVAAERVGVSWTIAPRGRGA